jgi:hypothetical protein
MHLIHGIIVPCDDSLPGPDDPLRAASGGFGKWLDLSPAYSSSSC